jgi:hypothetical protein
LAQLSGFRRPPKARQAYQQFMREAYATEIAPVVTERWAALKTPGNNLQTKSVPTGAFRAQIAREVFATLEESVRLEYAVKAKEEAAEAKKEYEDALKHPPSRSPEARQQ